MAGKVCGRRGLTLVEFVLISVVGGIVVYSLLTVFITGGLKEMNVKVYTVAQMLAEDKLEETMARDFKDIEKEKDTCFGGELSAFGLRIMVDYVAVQALDQPVPGPTDYKKIRVEIRHPELANPVCLESLRVDY